MGLSSSKLDGAEATAVAQKKGEHVQLVVQSEQLQDKTRRREMMTFNLIFATILIASQSLVYGMLLGGLNASLVTGAADSGEACFSNVDPTCPAGSIYKDFNLSTMEASTAVALLFVTGWAASLTANSPLERLGRKTTLILNSCLFLIGAALSSCGNYYTLFLGRIVLGWGGGTVTVMVPVLLSEIADRHTRGTITAVYQVTVTCGIFTVGVVGYLFIKNFAHGWQVVQAMPGLPPLLLLSFQSYIPESPKWLVRRGREEDARAVLKTLRPATYDVEQEIEAAEAQMGADAHHMQKRATWGDVFRPSPWRMIMGCTLMWLQSITGINSITFYSTTIFRFAGFNQPILATVSTGGINFLMSFVAFTVSDKVGRKTLVFGGACVMWCALLTISTVLLDDNSQPQLQGYFCVAGVLVFIGGFAVGFGTSVWVLMSEMMPNNLRAKAMSLFLSMNWCSDVVIAMTTLPAINGMGGVKDWMDEDTRDAAMKVGVAYLYYVFLGITTFALFFVHYFVPETMDKTEPNILKYIERNIFTEPNYVENNPPTVREEKVYGAAL